MNYISLGSNCSVAYQLQKLNLKKESLPFDWIRVNSIKAVLDLIENNFSGFLDDLVHVKDDEKFPFIDDTEEYFDKIQDKKTKIYKNQNIGFFHDFKDGVSFEEVKEKYDRRIKRFYEKIKEKSYFIRDEIKFKESDIPIYNQLNKLIKNYNKESKLVLIINDNKKSFNIDKLDQDITVFIDHEKITEWQHPIISSYLQLLK